MTQTSENVTWLTQEAYNQLKAELDHLSGPARTEIAAKIAAAREEGDLRENGGYHAAKEEQGKQELRVRQLTQLLENAKVGEAPAADGAVAPGMVVTIAFDGDKDDTLDVPARLARVREHGHRDVLAAVPAGLRRERQEDRRGRRVRTAERQAGLGEDPRGQAVQRLSPRAVARPACDPPASPVSRARPGFTVGAAVRGPRRGAVGVRSGRRRAVLAHRQRPEDHDDQDRVDQRGPAPGAASARRPDVDSARGCRRARGRPGRSR